jgi:molybdenum cofactor cytidylyltransferase
MAEAELASAPAALAVGDRLEDHVADLWRLLSLYRFVLVYRQVSRQKVLGLSPEAVEWLADRVPSDAMLVEADGARRLPFKVPHPHEPVVPASATLVVPVVGLDVIGQPLDDEHVYNPEPLTDIYGFQPGTPIYAAWVAQALRHQQLGLRGVPSGARVVPLLNKADTALRRARGRVVARIALRTPAQVDDARIDSVAIGAAGELHSNTFEVRRRVAAVVLAAGQATRMGRPKVLLPWDGDTVIGAIVNRLNAADLSDIVVVTGHKSLEVEAALEGRPVRCVYNPRYRAGEMISSFQAGLDALSDSTAACLLVLGDQPLLSGRVIWKVLEAYARGRGSIVAPSHGSRRGHPVLFDRAYWAELMGLEAPQAPREILRQYADEVHYVPVDTHWVLRDIDTPADYQQALREAGLE